LFHASELLDTTTKLQQPNTREEGGAVAPGGADAPQPGAAAPGTFTAALAPTGGAEEVTDPTSTNQTPTAPEAHKVQARTTKSPTKRRGNEIAGRDKLTDDDRKKIVKSHASMTNYLLWGMPGLLEPDQPHPPSTSNWRQFKVREELSEEAQGVGKWTVPTFMGFFWFRVSWWRGQHSVQQTIPRYDRLAGDVRNLLKQMTKWQLFNWINNITVHFDLLCCMVGKIANDWILDESMLTNTLLRNAVQSYLSVGEAQQAALYDQHGDSIKARMARCSKAA
jgi:hypothetical protein